ncbi:MAG: glycosyltransferase family 39 protein [Candidatus Bathyarchaeota archaeon]|nr:glycosyltransferase family 39 protein [Candidatus Bathyarchaeota archaeon]
MLREGFPPGADIGLHNSIIYSITQQEGKTNFLWNYFHMGGGTSVTFPGYHIFVLYLILLTGVSDYTVHALVVSFFSSLIVLVSFLLVRRAWSESAALIIAFLVAVSRFDVEMLMWGGYPNVVTLMLIPLAFYVFLEKDKFTLAPFFAVNTIVAGAIFLSHSLSAVIYVTIVCSVVLLGLIFAKKLNTKRSNVLGWLSTIVLGASIVLPFLVEVTPVYLGRGANAGTFTGSVLGIREAILSTKVLPLDLVIPLFVCFFLFFLFSKHYRGKMLSFPALLFAVWTLIPAVCTQLYLVGLYTDYNRFLYFVILPVITLIGLAIDHGALFFTKVATKLVLIANNLPKIRDNPNKTLRTIWQHVVRKNILTIFVLTFVIFAFLTVPIFLTAPKGIEIQRFYQLMDKPKFEVVQWAKQNTPVNSVFLTDAQFGWWFSGFSQRSTISAVDPQYLTNTREFEPAQAARHILDTDFLLDNGLIQVRDDGPYIGRHNPIFLAKLNNSYFPYSVFHFSNDEIKVTLRNNDKVEIIKLVDVPVKEAYILNNSEWGTIHIVRGNSLFNFTQQITVYKGIRFANVTQIIKTDNPTVSFDTIHYILHAKGKFMEEENGRVAAFVDVNMKVVGQIIFTKGQPITTPLTKDNLAGLELLYNLNAKKNSELNFYVGIYQYPKNPESNLTEKEQNAVYSQMIINSTNGYLEKKEDAPPLEIFDYQQAIVTYDVDYIALRDQEALPRFANDPNFHLVFINNEVAVFRISK